MGRPLETFFGETVPTVLQYGILATKVAFVAPFVGGLALAATGGAFVLHAGTRGIKKVVSMFIDEVSKDKNETFDPENRHDMVRLQRIMGPAHQHFVDDLRQCADIAGLQQLPKVYFKKADKNTPQQEHMVGVMSKSDGSDPIILMGEGAPKTLSREEMRGVIAHEITHLKERHTQKINLRLGRGLLNAVTNLAILGVAAFGPLPFIPVLAGVIASNLVFRTLGSIRSRHHERLCDRGAAAITGETTALGTALDKIREKMLHALELKNKFAAAAKKTTPKPLKKPGPVARFITAQHPTNKTRKRLLDKFAKKYADFCADRRKLFTAFNTAAQPPANNNTPATPKPRNGTTP